jgi:hypothetical protein
MAVQAGICTAPSSPENSEHSGLERTEIITLEHDVLDALCRRSRRHYRTIQSLSKASLKLDRPHSQLHITGSEEDIEQVRTQLDNLTGPSLNVSAALWAELMRARTCEDVCESAVAMIQKLGGCRIHIERTCQMIHLFGAKGKMGFAEHLVRELEGMCIETAVDVKGPLYLDGQVLLSFAQEFGVSLHVDGATVSVFGIAGAVAEAVEELEKRDRDQQPLEPELEVAKSSESAKQAISETMQKLQELGGANSLSIDADVRQVSASTMHGVIIAALPPATPPASAPPINKIRKETASAPPPRACPTCWTQATGNFCVYCGHSTGCPTCGTYKFCVNCGQATEKSEKLSKDTSKPNFAPMVPRSPSYQSDTLYQMPMSQPAAMKTQMMPFQFVRPNMQTSGFPVMVPPSMMSMMMVGGSF